MHLREQFKQIVENSIFLLDSQVIVPYIVDCFKSICDFLTEKTQTSIRYTYDNTDMLVQGFYKIGIENCEKEYAQYNSILRFKAQYQLDYQIMKQTRQQWFNVVSTERINFENKNYTLDICKFEDRNLISKSDMEFYVNRYKFYNSFRITLS